jgi:hypothetical protein
VPLTEGSIYCIKMESSDFFSSLTLEDLRGNLLAMNTDFFEELPECIVFRAPATNRYRLIASATEPKAGFYTITIREMPILMRVDSGLWVTDPLHGDAFRKTHELTLIEGRRYIIDLASEDFEAFVQLLDEEDTMVAFNDGGCHPRPARIVYTAPRTGAFRVVATSAAPFATGAYTLTVCEE